MASNSTFTSMLAGARHASVSVAPQLDFVVDVVSRSGPWTILLTLLAMAVAYDQSMFLVLFRRP